MLLPHFRVCRTRCGTTQQNKSSSFTRVISGRELLWYKELTQEVQDQPENSLSKDWYWDEDIVLLFSTKTKQKTVLEFQLWQETKSLYFYFLSTELANTEPSILGEMQGEVPVSSGYISVSLSIHRASWWLRWWRICLQCRRPGFNPWGRKIPGDGNGDPYITFFFMCLCLKTPYLIYIVDSLTLNSQPTALWVSPQQSLSKYTYLLHWGTL